MMKYVLGIYLVLIANSYWLNTDIQMEGTSNNGASPQVINVKALLEKNSENERFTNSDTKLKQYSNSPEEFTEFYGKSKDNTEGGLELSTIILIGTLVVVGVSFLVFFLLCVCKKKQTKNPDGSMAYINSLFNKHKKIRSSADREKVSVWVTDLVEESSSSKYNRDRYNTMKFQTVDSITRLIIKLLNFHNDEEPAFFERGIETDITHENNVFRDVKNTYYFRWINSKDEISKNGKITVDIKEVSDGLWETYSTKEENRIIHLGYADFLIEQIEYKDNIPAMFHEFCIDIWMADWQIYKLINTAILFDSITSSIGNGLPEFYKWLFKGKPLNYYKTILRNSTKFLKLFNHSIEMVGESETVEYSWYVYLKGKTFLDPEEGGRYSFVTYQSAYNHKIQAEGEIKESREHGVLFCINVPKGCK